MQGYPKMSFAGVYLNYSQKAEKRGRTREEVDTTVCWLKIRYLDKLINELAKGKAMETILTK